MALAARRDCRVQASGNRTNGSNQKIEITDLKSEMNSTLTETNHLQRRRKTYGGISLRRPRH